MRKKGINSIENKPFRSLKIGEGISLIIPVFNEEKTLETIVKRCSDQSTIKQLIIVDDGSTDGSKVILNKISKNFPSSRTAALLTRKPLVTIIHHNKNLGKGVAIKTGLTKVQGKYVMVQDADLEYYPEEIIGLFKKAEKSEDGIVFGSRSHNKKKGYILAQLGNWYLNLLFNSLFGFKLKDSYTCYKLIPSKVWREVNLQSGGFEIDSELVSKLGSRGYKIIEAPISYHPRKYSEGKKIKWLDVIKATTAALKVKLFER